MSDPTIVDVLTDGSHFAEVLKLARQSSKTLGFLPEGAFVEASGDRRLVAAIDQDNRAVGYVLFRRMLTNEAAIVHLCVSPTSRGRGVARMLFNAVKARCAERYAIRVTCRRDFAEAGLWPKLGFTYVGEKRGRGGLLGRWCYEIAQLPLIAFIAKSRPAPTTRVLALDANVFFDLDEDRPGAEQSRALEDDWLEDMLELTVTHELFNEISRHDDKGERDRQLTRARRYRALPRDVQREDGLIAGVTALLGRDNGPNELSDVSQLVMASVGGASVFVTRDTGLLERADDLEDALGIQVMSPHEIIGSLDEDQRREAYRPRRLAAGPHLSRSLARASDVERVVELIHAGESIGEDRRHTMRRLRDMLAQPERFECVLIQKGESLLASYVLDRSETHAVRVPFFAAENSTLGDIAVLHFGNALLIVAADEGRSFVHVASLKQRVGAGLGSLGFSRDQSGWAKITLRSVGTQSQIASRLERLADDQATRQLARGYVQALQVGRESERLVGRDAVELERRLWPAKIVASGIPSFIVPIQPRWAKELFDIGLAERTLFGGDPKLLLNATNVYYRSTHANVLQAPARVLWYVSRDQRYPGSKAVRACSLIADIAFGKPKTLFSRHRHLGVYEWRHVLEVANGSHDESIMSFRFTNTELFEDPVSWDALQNILRTHRARENPLVSPIQISEAEFLDIYRMGRNVRDDAA